MRRTDGLTSAYTDDKTSQMEPKAIDLFSGCGGISLGLQRAGFRVIAAADNNRKYSATYVKNFPSVHFLHDSLAEINPKDLMKTLGLKPGDLDLLAGGPPCQGFSKNVPRSQRRADSQNNKLIVTFLDYCDTFRPKAVMMENVAEMKSGFDEAYTNQIRDRLSKIGYKVHEGVFNAADYGVPQRRRRAFFVATRNDLSNFKFPATTHGDGNGIPPHLTIRDAISDLPKLEDGEGEPLLSYEKAAETAFQKLMRKGSKKLSNHKTRKLKPLQSKRLSCLKPGQGIKDLPSSIRPKGGYSGAYGRLTWEMTSPTITRWVFHPGSGRWGHPEQIRVLTTREAARIQSFPDHFVFHGTFTDMAGQIGNAVPPLLSEAVARAIKSALPGS